MSFDPRSLDAAFPCRIVLDENRALAEVGPGMRARVPAAAIGMPLESIFRVHGDLGAVGQVFLEANGALFGGTVVREECGRIHVLGRALDRSPENRDQSAALLLHELARLPLGDLEGSLRRILRADSEALGFERVSFWSRAADGSAITCKGLHIRTGDVFERGLSLYAKDVPAYFAALNTGTVIAATDAHTDPRTSEFSAGYLAPLGIGAMLDVPVFVGGNCVGVICHEHVGGPREHSAHDQQVAMAVAQALAQLLEADARRRAEEAVLASEARLRYLVEVSPIPVLVTNVADGQVLYANPALAKLLRTTREDLLTHKTVDWYVNPDDRVRLVDQVRKTGLAREEELAIRRTDGSIFWGMLSIDPLVFDGRDALLTGVVDLSEHKRAEDERRAVLAKLAERDEIITRDLERARAFQDSMLPPAILSSVVRVEAALAPLEEISGDVYEHEVDDGLLRVFIADAAGHGVSAALTTMFLRSEYEVARRGHSSPSRLLDALNRRLVRFVGRFHMHFTAIAMTLDLATGRLTWSTAGHPSPYLIRDGKPVALETGGSFVGLLPEIEFPEWSQDLVPGDRITLLTDGITEAMDKDGTPFIAQALDEVIGLAPIDILSATRRFAGMLEDDATVVSLTWRP